MTTAVRQLTIGCSGRRSRAVELLKEIRGILWLIMVCVLLGVLFFFVRIITFVGTQYKTAVRDTWADKAAAMFEAADYKKLESFCDERLSETPNDALSQWWKARSLMEQGEIDRSKELFRRVALNEPSWKAKYVDPYLRSLDESENAS